MKPGWTPFKRAKKEPRPSLLQTAACQLDKRSDRRPVPENWLSALLLRGLGRLSLLLLLGFAGAAALLRLGRGLGHLTAPITGSLCCLTFTLRCNGAAASQPQENFATK